ncbi:MAG TPA: two-component regulator propeller domain-containing protein [Blastocatellia bacterium]|nr:two-component regulator propeller domain-containing protein [Blastocatellia bacterium]HMY73590.1 two-component regulator propeller domain-containing protein [Blastocatellia bacterium]HNG33346.1 two-component regulator propeller domain-containing protein [Blastocatellia bacterium]
MVRRKVSFLKSVFDRRLATLLSAALPILLLAVAEAPAQYRFDSWTTENGLPQNSVNAILQTRDGYLWFTTFNGLVRYNGAQFTVFDAANTPAIPNQRLGTLVEDREGNLWIKGESGALTRHRDGGFVLFTTKQGLPQDDVNSIIRTAEGEVLALTPKGAARYRNGRFEPVALPSDGLETDAVYQGRSGTIWYRGGGLIRRFRKGQRTAFNVSNGVYEHLYEDRQGRLWIGTSRPGELIVLAGDNRRVYTVRDGLPPALVTSFYEDRAGVLWFGTRGGLVRFKDDRLTLSTTSQGLSSNDISCIYEDREGTLWLGTRDNGLMRAVPRVITSYSEKDGLTGKTFYPVLEDRAGDIWIGNQGVNRFHDGKFEFFALASPRSREASPVGSLYEDRAGRLLLGAANGVISFQDGRFSFDHAEAFSKVPLTMLQDRTGAFWYGFRGALLREKDGVRQWFGTKDGLQEYVQPIFEDRRGRIWIGSYGGLAEYVDGRLRIYTQRDGLSSNRIRAIYEDSDGVLWIGTYDGGLNRFKNGKFTRYTVAEGMFSNNVFSILEDEHGNFWMGANQGIHRVSRRQLNEFAEGRRGRIDAVSYGKADGMLNTECNGGKHPSALKASDGRLWFPTLNGVAVVNPDAVPFNAVPPPVMIEAATIDRETLDIRRTVELFPHQSQLEIAYAALSFIKPEHVRFKYRLEGLDEDWNEVGTRRTAYYTHVKAGHYTFRVIAANSDGVWNETGATISLRIHPPIWATPWFAGAVLSLGLTLSVWLYRRRIRKLERARAAQEAFARQLLASQEGERKRIAAELHDGLGQNLLVIKNWAVLARRALEPESKARTPLDEVTTAATRSIEEVREIAHNLRPYHLDEIGLTDAVAAMTERIAEASGIEFKLELEDLRGRLSSDAEINLYRIIQEAVNNVVKHAQADTVELSLRRHGQTLTVVIKDNGRGFDPAEATRRHERGFGLAGLAERVRLLGGKENIQSSPGQGTTITVTLDLP